MVRKRLTALAEPKKTSIHSTETSREMSSGASDSSTHKKRYPKQRSKAEKLYLLSKKQVLTISFLWAFQPYYLNSTCHLILRWGGLEVLFGYMLLSVILVAPLTMIYLFLGKYSRENYIKVWEMLPLLKGIALSVTVFQLGMELFNVSHAGICLIYIAKVFKTKLPWSDCSFPEASDKCVSMYPTAPITLKCCNNIFDSNNCYMAPNFTMLRYPAFEYLENYIINYNGNPNASFFKSLRVELVYCVFITWFLIYITLTQSHKRFIHFSTPILSTFIMLEVLASLLSIFIVGPVYPLMPISRMNLMNFLHFNYWTALSSNIIFDTLPLHFICLGSVADEEMKPTQTAIEIVAIKMMSILALMSILSISTQITFNNYKLQDFHCIYVTGLQLLFGIIVDILTRLELPHLVIIIYFVATWIVIYAATVNSLAFICDSIIDVIPKINRFRISFITIVCVTLALLNTLILTHDIDTLMMAWRLFVSHQLPIVLAFIFAIGMCIYTFKKFENDYYFTYGVTISQYWLSNLKLTVLVTGMMTCAVIVRHRPTPIKPLVTLNMKHACYLFTSITLVLIPIYAGVLYMNYKRQEEASRILQSTYNWGPPTMIRKYQRLRFNPERHVCLTKQDQRCKHNCLLNSPNVREEIKQLKQNYINYSMLKDRA